MEVKIGAGGGAGVISSSRLQKCGAKAGGGSMPEGSYIWIRLLKSRAGSSQQRRPPLQPTGGT
jgi:hypothetical protein